MIIILIGSRRQVNFQIDPDSEKFQINAEWDSVLRRKWDMLPPIFPETFCHVIRILKLTNSNDFFLTTVPVSTDCFEDNLKGDNEYRRSAANNCRSQFTF